MTIILTSLCIIVLYGASYSVVDGAARIIGGIAAHENQFRYMVSLQQRSETNQTTRGHRCGGALVSYRHALTTASCLYNNDAGRFTQILERDYWLFAGSARLDNNATFLLQSIDRFTIHPQFDPRVRFVNDIAIITAFSSFPTYLVSVLRLPYADVITTPYICHSPGWGGYDSSISASVDLLYTDKFVTTNDACFQFYYRHQNITINTTPDMLCAVPYSNTSSCQGDSGNPLVCNNDILGVQFLSKNCSLPVTDGWQPDVYTRVFRYKAWIEGIVIGPQLPSAASTYQLCFGLLAMLVIVQIVTSTS